MKTIGRCLGQAADGSLWFWCKGCDGPHSLQVGEGSGPRWGYNGNPDAPTFTPSVLSSYRQHDRLKVCHSFVTGGRIQYLSDCTHQLAGQTIDLPEWESSWTNW
ncbi:DUF6527 family protein [Pseudomonas donghuensis]|uniref:DUF6527 family protein n=1 Tax=Pseudomonas donghuensis TaxID=1163398 RepID=UPI00215F5BF0|nr:DUF6527 family protein [Pseudomonas donghuensis]UVL26248.1 ammonia monooxygenase [Pseudomonas donghuensis]